MPTAAANLAVDPDEKHVEEAHCSECNKPISAIPNWYAQVRVKFTCDACRQKSPRLATAPPAFAAGGPAVAVVAVVAPVIADDPDAALDPDALDPEAEADLDEDVEAEADEADEVPAEE